MNINHTKSPIVSTTWLYEHLNDPDLIILDTTIKKVTSDTQVSKQSQKIKGARFFDLKKDFSDKSSDIPNMLPSPEAFTKACRDLGITTNHTIIVYDSLGIYSSPRVWWMFKTMGHTNIAVLDGGLPAWQEEGLPCEQQEVNTPEYDQGNFEASYTPALVTNAEHVLSKINNSDILMLDARSPGRFCGQEPEPRKNLKGGHIPNSKNLHYTEVLHNGKMKTTSELKEVLQPFNIENKKLIFTCGSGITACIIMLAVQLAGYQNVVSVYDGSWSEWGQLNNAPINC